MKKLFLPSLLLLILGLGMVLPYNIVMAVGGTSEVRLENPLSPLTKTGEIDKNVKAGSVEAKTGVTSMPLVVGRLVKESLKYIGAITLLIFLYGGFLWLTSGGNAEQVKSGADTVLWAVVGLFIIFSSYAILDLVLDALGL
jgi:hypothetical protein